MMMFAFFVCFKLLCFDFVFVRFVPPSLVALVLVLVWLITTWVLVFMFAVLVVKCLVVCVAGLAGLVLFGACLWFVDLGVYDCCGCCVVVVDLWPLCGVADWACLCWI